MAEEGSPKAGDLEASQEISETRNDAEKPVQARLTLREFMALPGVGISCRSRVSGCRSGCCPSRCNVRHQIRLTVHTKRLQLSFKASAEALKP